MNREKYIKDKSYREGYKEGRKEGIDAVINTYNVYLNRLDEDYLCVDRKWFFETVLQHMRAESEEK